MKRNNRNIQIIFILIFAALICFPGCSDDSGSNDTTEPGKEIISFVFEAARNEALDTDAAGAISGTRIRVAVPLDTDTSSLIATFKTNGESVTIDGVVQESGVTANDFTSDLEYTVTKIDGTTGVYTVTVFEGSIITFEELSLEPDSYWAGDEDSVSFTSKVAIFENSWEYMGEGQGYVDGVDFYWDGFAYSNMTDTNDEHWGPLYQFCVFGESGANSSSNFGICYIMLDYETYTYDPIPQEVTFTDRANYIPEGFHVTNTTYTIASLVHGDQFAKPFGGDTGDDADWFILVVEGFDSAGDSTGVVEFYLADYRFANNDFDYMVTTWTWVDLSSLGTVAKLTFSIDSSDADENYGINTPAYFALDNLTLRSVE
ncbi:MAG: DUF4465 domain-containing protein [Spirochaetes bacterium]|nr:DUF4465 domain-containing protein [Spirochaetota bacterium]